jgi:hypothetical protein
VPLSGGYVFAIPPGQFYTRNLTPDEETGLGKVSDSALARALRSGVGHDGRALLPFMEMQGLADDDLQAVVSYLRTQAPVHNPIPAHHFNLLGKVVKATALAKPVGPSATPPVRAPRGASVEHHERSGGRATRQAHRGSVRGSLPSGPSDSGFADAVAGVLANGGRRPARDLPLSEDRPAGEA